ncbi:hypothetical protein EVAR_36323_1 [Eumeta japonica]|uniref:Uncharacterized protein n=1 Tax=Eumeta variegata TaxID=151549 RepID=A0A4C1VIG2_EUMVA|nr:hypothetical protein EVAR_36323_1 [Eumeta japonica]
MYDICVAYKSGNLSLDEYDAHEKRKDGARNEKEQDKEKAKSEHGSEVVAFTVALRPVNENSGDQLPPRIYYSLSIDLSSIIYPVLNQEADNALVTTPESGVSMGKSRIRAKGEEIAIRLTDGRRARVIMAYVRCQEEIGNVTEDYKEDGSEEQATEEPKKKACTIWCWIQKIVLFVVQQLLNDN